LQEIDDPVRRSARTLDLLTAGVLATILARILGDATRINHDSASLLMGAVMVREGRLPLSALFGTLNPPVVTYINLAVVGVAGWFGANVILVYLLFVFAAVAGSVAAIRRLAWAPGLAPAPAASLAALVWAAVSLLPFFVVEFNFGQREHLLALLLVPYLIGRWRAWEGHSPSRVAQVLLGVFAALGTCVKPHYALVAVAVEAAWVLSRRRLAPVFSADVVAYVATGAAFAGHVFLLPAAFRNAFLGAVAWAGAGYDVYAVTWAELSAQPSIGFAIPAALSVLALFTWRHGPALRLAAMLAAMSLVSAAIYFQQHKGWSYHALPAFEAAVLAVAVALGQIERVTPGPAADVERTEGAAGGGWVVWLVTAAAAAAAVNMVFMGVRLAGAGVQPAIRTPFHAALARNSRPLDEVLVITTNVFPMYPALLQLDRRPLASSWGPMMSIASFQAGRRGAPGAFPYPKPEEMPPAERGFLEGLASAIRSGRPRLIAIPEGTLLQGCPPGFSMLEYLDRAPAVAEALSSYGLAERAWGYRFLRRRDLSEQPGPPGARRDP
jgi:hypothetical protein